MNGRTKGLCLERNYTLVPFKGDKRKMSKCNQCPYNYYDYEGNYTDCSLYDVRNPSLILWNENKCRCRIPLFVLKIMHKRDMKAEDKHWGDLSEETVCKNQGW